MRTDWAPGPSTTRRHRRSWKHQENRCNANAVLTITLIEPAGLRWCCLFMPPFSHSSAIMRRELMTQNNLRYDENIRYSQDYDLWSKFFIFSDVDVIQDHLVLLRKHSSNIGVMHTEKPSVCINQVIKRQLEALLPTFRCDGADIETLRSIHRCFPKLVETKHIYARHLILNLFEAAMQKMGGFPRNTSQNPPPLNKTLSALLQNA